MLCRAHLNIRFRVVGCEVGRRDSLGRGLHNLSIKYQPLHLGLGPFQISLLGFYLSLDRFAQLLELAIYKRLKLGTFFNAITIIIVSIALARNLETACPRNID